MAQIIQFRGKQEQASNGYDNLARLIAMATANDILNFYIESIEELDKSGYITAEEKKDLEQKGREKRIAIASPEKRESEQVSEPGVYSYTPEMGGTRPDCQMEASSGYYGGHWYVDTPLELKGRGIQFLKKYEEKDFTTPDHYRVGWNEYRVTNKAFEKLKSQYTISHECCLD